MNYLIVGLDTGTLARWHQNVLTHDVDTATRIARSRAAAQGIDLVVAAVIGPNSSVAPGSDADHMRTPRAVPSRKQSRPAPPTGRRRLERAPDRRRGPRERTRPSPDVLRCSRARPASSDLRARRMVRRRSRASRSRHHAIRRMWKSATTPLASKEQRAGRGIVRLPAGSARVVGRAHCAAFRCSPADLQRRFVRSGAVRHK